MAHGLLAKLGGKIPRVGKTQIYPGIGEEKVWNFGASFPWAGLGGLIPKLGISLPERLNFLKFLGPGPWAPLILPGGPRVVNAKFQGFRSFQMGRVNTPGLGIRAFLNTKGNSLGHQVGKGRATAREGSTAGPRRPLPKLKGRPRGVPNFLWAPLWSGRGGPLVAPGLNKGSRGTFGARGSKGAPKGKGPRGLRRATGVMGPWNPSLPNIPQGVFPKARWEFPTWGNTTLRAKGLGLVRGPIWA